MAKEGGGGMGLGDRLVLLTAWVATCGLVYLLGFYVGKGVQERRLGAEERVVRLPVTSQPPPEGQRSRSGSEFGFYDKLMGEPGAGRPAETIEPAGTVAATSAKPALAPKPVPAPAPAPSPAVVPLPARPDAPERLPAPVAASRPLPPPAPPPAAHSAAGGWTVLANPTRSRDEADALLRRLRGRGYQATLVRVLRDGGTWYRVQVGRFATPEQANETMRRLRDHEGVAHVFVASE